MLKVMAIEESDRVRELKLTAKWAVDNNEKKKAISELAHRGLRHCLLSRKFSVSLLMKT